MKQQSSLVAIGLAATAAVVCVLGWLHLAGAKASAQDAAAPGLDFFTLKPLA